MNQVSIGSDNGLSFIFSAKPLSEWSVCLLSIGPLGTNFTEILTKIQNFSFTKMHMKISSAKRQPSCPGGDELSCIFFQFVSHLVKLTEQCTKSQLIWPHQQRILTWTSYQIFPRTHKCTFSLFLQFLETEMVLIFETIPCGKQGHIFTVCSISLVNSSSPGQNGCHFTLYAIFRCIFVNENVCILIKISLKFVPKGPVDNKQALV